MNEILIHFFVSRLLASMKTNVRFSFDATKIHLDQGAISQKFDFVIFNFPHTGVGEGTAEGVQSNQILLENFFLSALQVLNEKGEIHVTLRTSTFYRSWEIEKQAKKAGLELKGY